MRLDCDSRRFAVAGPGLHPPRPGRPDGPDPGGRLVARPVENEVEVLVCHEPMRRLVVDLETAVGERQPVDRLSGARHRLRAGADQNGEVEASGARSAAGQRDRRGALVARHGNRQSAVGRDSEAEIEAVQLETPNLHLRKKHGERVEPDLAARRGQHRPPGRVAHGQTAETQTDAKGVVHEVGRSEIDRIAVAHALLEARGDLVMQRLQIDRRMGEPRGEDQNREERDQRPGFRHAPDDPRGLPRARAARGRGKAGTSGAVAHAAHGGSGARAGSDVEPADQSEITLRGSRRHEEPCPLIRKSARGAAIPRRDPGRLKRPARRATVGAGANLLVPH